MSSRDTMSQFLHQLARNVVNNVIVILNNDAAIIICQRYYFAERELRQ